VPIDLKHSGFDEINHVHHHGAYAAVLQTVCEQATYEGGAVLNCATSQQLAEVERSHAERTATLVKQRMGEPVHCQSYQLPDGLPGPLFQHFARGGRQQSFRVTPDDVITFRPRPESR
jgi:hypothetical protein